MLHRPWYKEFRAYTCSIEDGACAVRDLWHVSYSWSECFQVCVVIATACLMYQLYIQMLHCHTTALSLDIFAIHDDVIKWKHFPRYWPFVRGLHRSPVNLPHKGPWHRALMFSLIWAWRNDWVKNGEAGDLRRHRAHCDVIVMHISIRRLNRGSNHCNTNTCFHVITTSYLQRTYIKCKHDDVINWKHFPRYWQFGRGIHWSPVNSPQKGQWRGAFWCFLWFAPE